MLDGQMLAAIKPVLDALEQLGIPYYIGGSIASATYGEPRSTNDADIIVDLNENDLPTLIERLQGSYYVSDEAALEAIRYRKSFNLIHQSSSYKVDMFLPKGDAASIEGFSRKVRARIGPNQEAWVASAEQSVLSKLQWYRATGETSERQWRDILGVLKVQGDSLDGDYLRHWAAETDVEDLLKRAIADAGLVI